MTDNHWDTHYTAKSPGECSWFESTPSTLDDVLALTTTASAVIDVGCGSRGILTHLAQAGYSDLTGVDVSAEALKTAREGLASEGSTTFVQADIRHLAPWRKWDLWHDRAVYHFLVDEADRRSYRNSLSQSLKPGGQMVMATFSPEGPGSCAGLPTQRYSETELSEEFSNLFSDIKCHKYQSDQPGGDQRPYVVCRFAGAI